MIRTVDEYLSFLKKELRNCDPAIIQDALSDAEEHLRTALSEISEGKETEILSSAIERYGTPEETAAAYREIEFHYRPALSTKRKASQQRLHYRYFGVLGESRAWGAFLYMIISPLTGIFFGLWAICGGIVSLSSLLLIIGIPITGMFLLSIRGIGLMEGRIVESLLGQRMPRRNIFLDPNLGVWDKMKTLFMELQTWKVFLYLMLLIPLGFIYFVLAVISIPLSLAFIFAPLLELIFHLPLELFGTGTFTPVWLLPAITAAGLVLLPGFFHLFKGIGSLHGRLARFLLIRKEASGKSYRGHKAEQ